MNRHMKPRASNSIPWTKAKGTCGFNLGNALVHAAYVKGVALFAYKNEALSKPGAPFFQCIVTGHMTCGGHSLQAVKDAGVKRATAWGTKEADRKLTFEEFKALIANPERLFPDLEVAEQLPDPPAEVNIDIEPHAV